MSTFGDITRFIVNGKAELDDETIRIIKNYRGKGFPGGIETLGECHTGKAFNMDTETLRTEFTADKLGTEWVCNIDLNVVGSPEFKGILADNQEGCASLLRGLFSMEAVVYKVKEEVNIPKPQTVKHTPTKNTRIGRRKGRKGR